MYAGRNEAKALIKFCAPFVQRIDDYRAECHELARGCRIQEGTAQENPTQSLMLESDIHSKPRKKRNRDVRWAVVPADPFWGFGSSDHSSGERVISDYSRAIGFCNDECARVAVCLIVPRITDEP